MKIKVILVISYFCFSIPLLDAQDIPEHISYNRIYEFLDEMATDGRIDLNSAVKPYSRIFIALKLRDLNENDASMNSRQKSELFFFLNEFSLELNKLPNSKLDLSKNEKFNISFIQPAINYKDSLLKTRITPILGMHITKNENGSITKRWYGAEIQASIGKNLSLYASLRDISFNGPLLARPLYLNDFQGCEYKESYNSNGGGDFSDMRGGVKYAWKWGSLGLIKDNIVWGDNYHGSNIISGRAPSFPMVTLHLKPAKWIELSYIHAWLISNVIDSTNYYMDNSGKKSFRMANKFMAANMITFTPIAKLNISVGNSIIYAESQIQAAYLIPIAFYKSIDHTLTKGLKIENQNSQIFINLSSRIIKHLHLYTSIFADEIMFNRFKQSNPETNPISYKAGAIISNLIPNVSLIGEFTRNSIINYKHSIPVLAWSSNSYNLGHYLGDNSQEMFLSLQYKPIRGLDLDFSYTNAQHGNEYSYNRSNILEIISQPFMANKVWENKSFGLSAKYEIMNNAYALVNATFSNIKAYDATSNIIAGEYPNRNAQDYLNLFTPKFLQGKNKTLTIGFSIGF